MLRLCTSNSSKTRGLNAGPNKRWVSGDQGWVAFTKSSLVARLSQLAPSQELLESASDSGLGESLLCWCGSAPCFGIMM